MAQDSSPKSSDRPKVHSFPTLGEIDRSWKAEMRAGADFEELWIRYDEQFGHRFDYRVWRALFRPAGFDATKVGEPNQIIGLIADALSRPASLNETYTWSLLLMTAGILTRSEIPGVSGEALEALAHAADYALHQRLTPVPGSERGCAMVRVLASDAIQRVLGRHGPMTISQAADYVRHLVRHLRHADPDWKPGKGLRLDLKVQAFFPYSSFELVRHAIRVLFRAQFVVDSAIRRNALNALNVQEVRLLDRSAELAISAWKLGRAVRIGQERLTARNVLSRSDNTVRDEMFALRAAAVAARHAGNHLKAAYLAHYLLRVIPKELISEPDFKTLGTHLGRAIREAGLEVDSRFLIKGPREKSSAVAALPEDVLSSSNGKPTEALASAVPPSDLSEISKPEADQFVVMRLAFEQKSDSDWAEVLNSIEPGSTFASDTAAWGFKALQNIVRTHEEGGTIAEPTLRSAFRLNLRYGKVQSASKLLTGFPLRKDDVRCFISAVRQVVWMAPFGLDLTTHRSWQTSLRNVLVPSMLREEWSWGELSVIHETLVGMGQSIIRAVPESAKRLFALRFYGKLRETDVREITDDSQFAVARGPRELEKPDFLRTLTKLSGSSLGAPDIVSVVSIGERKEHFSVLALSRFADRRQRIVHIPQVVEALTRFREQLINLSVISDVYWPSPLRTLAESIRAMIPDPPRKPHWLMLALEPELAGLPWQNLMMRLEENTVVSLIPSIPWVLQEAGRAARIWPASAFETTDARDLEPLTRMISASRRTPNPKSVGIVAGHGTESASGIPRIVGGSGRAISFERWVEIAERRIVTVHSCFGGSTRRAVLGDFGGLAGLALGLGCRIICAPIAEVPALAAIKFQEQLTKTGVPSEIGLRYFDAVRQNPAVSFYNAYGFHNESCI